MFDCILKHATRLCDAHLGVLGSYDGKKYQTLAQRGASKEFAKYLMNRGPFVPPPGSAFREMITRRKPASLADYKETAAFRERAPNIVALVELGGVRTFVVAPMLKEGRVVGGIAIYRRAVRPFSGKQVEILRSFAAQAAIAIENVRLLNDTRHALEAQTATAEILEITASSPSSVQPVFDAIARSALKLCDASFSTITRFDGKLIHVAATHNMSGEALSELHKAFPQPLSRRGATPRAILERAVVHIPDVTKDPEYSQIGLAQASRLRAVLAVPMLLDGNPIGAINVARTEPGEFPPQQIELLKTFAIQAVIAIENVRLFNETMEALERQTATAEILKVISESPTNVQPVFDSVVERAMG